MRLPQVNFPIRKSDWEQLRALLKRCESTERTFAGAFWATLSIGVSGLFATGGFAIVPNVPEWLMRTSLTVTGAAFAAAIVLGAVERRYAADHRGSVQDALAFMQTCEDGLVAPGDLVEH